jgi:hypothetical protein
MITKEALKGRIAELETRIQEQRSIQAHGAQEIERIERRVSRARDEENVIGGALQNCQHLLQQIAQVEKEAQKE